MNAWLLDHPCLGPVLLNCILPVLAWLWFRPDEELEAEWVRDAPAVSPLAIMAVLAFAILMIFEEMRALLWHEIRQWPATFRLEGSPISFWVLFYMFMTGSVGLAYAVGYLSLASTLAAAKARKHRAE